MRSVNELLKQAMVLLEYAAGQTGLAAFLRRKKKREQLQLKPAYIRTYNHKGFPGRG
jgi:hypothetical protein